MNKKLTILLSVIVVFNSIRYIMAIQGGSDSNYDYVMLAINLLALLFFAFSLRNKKCEEK
ncbi:hypothetical protein RYX56_01070 [Alkalihalophilus lindianensis]|uniref:Uncharacterized protein n=1 Tax=Alkalihalophilus lindianensis TaxID=1630542 RepID=A0ABU3X4Z0_9BACI|nr:hypothetical protein [Alkalihalophilus lindianensis]MDV2682957.1 hypothetical protein [Alkalihalophilus lindianensis]